MNTKTIPSVSFPADLGRYVQEETHISFNFEDHNDIEVTLFPAYEYAFVGAKSLPSACCKQAFLQYIRASRYGEYDPSIVSTIAKSL